MTEEELIKKLKELHDNDDAEVVHVKADNLLLEFIDDEKVKKAFRGVRRWYA